MSLKVSRPGAKAQSRKTEQLFFEIFCYSERSDESNLILTTESHWILRHAQNDKGNVFRLRALFKLRERLLPCFRALAQRLVDRHISQAFGHAIRHEAAHQQGQHEIVFTRQF